MNRIHVRLHSCDPTMRPLSRWIATIDGQPFADIYWIQDKEEALISVYSHCVRTDDPCTAIAHHICQAPHKMRPRVGTTLCTLTFKADHIYRAIDLPGQEG